MSILKNWKEKNKKDAETLLAEDFQIGEIKNKRLLWFIPGFVGLTVIPLFLTYIIFINDISKREEVIPHVLFWTFFIVGALSFLLATIYSPIYKIIKGSSIKKFIEEKLFFEPEEYPLLKGLLNKKPNLSGKKLSLTLKNIKRHLKQDKSLIKEKEEYEKLTRDTHDHLGPFLSPLPRQVMSMGVIPIIFGILGIIIFEHEIPEIISGLDFLMLLIILGGMTEAVAFYFGFMYPEPVAPAKAGSFSDVEKLIDTTDKLSVGIKDLQSKIPTKATVEIDKANLIIKFY